MDKIIKGEVKMTRSSLKTIKNVAEFLNCSEITVRRLIAARRIPYHRVGCRYLFSDEDISEYLRFSKVEPIVAEEVTS